MYCAGIAISLLSASLAMRRMLSNLRACFSRESGKERKRSMTPSACAASKAALLIELEDADGVLAQELWPHVIAERHVGHVGEDALEREPHREVARVHDLVGAARVRVVDDVLRVVLRRERAGRVV